MSAFICQQKAAGFAVELICRTLGVSRSAHYQRATGQRSARAVADEQLVTVIRQIHEENFEAYGCRKLHLALRRQGVQVGRDRVKRLMRQHGIQGAKRRGFTDAGSATAPVTRWRTLATPRKRQRPARPGNHGERGFIDTEPAV